MRKLLLAAAIGALVGGFLVFQWLLWRVYVSEGIRDTALTIANDAVSQCQKPSPWPRRRGLNP